MLRKISALVAAAAFALATFSPAMADARDRRGHGYYDRGHHGHYYRHRGRDDGDAVAAGVVGLVLGLAIGSLASQPREPRVSCYDNYQRCPPPPPRGYYDRGYEEGYYDPRYDNRGSAYERDYGLEGGPYAEDYYEPRAQCMRRERQWDRYANRYVTVDVPC